MADWYAEVAAEWKALALTTLTGIVGADSFFTVIRSLQIDLITEVESSLDNASNAADPPYLVMGLGQERRVQSGNIAMLEFDCPLTWTLIVAESADSTLDKSAYARSLLDLLRVAFNNPANLTKSQWMGADGEITSDESVAFVGKNLDIVAAELAYTNGFRTQLT